MTHVKFSVCADASSARTTCASAAIEEGGMEFPLVRTFWQGEVSRALGAGTRYKKIAFVGVKVGPCVVVLA
jgi:hypothetical protein